MKTFTKTLALATGLTLGLAAPFAQADAITPLTTADMTSATFNSMFQPISSDPVMSSPFTYQGSPSSGNVVSQVFQGTGTAAGLYAYAYQYDLNPTSTDSDNAPVDLKGTSWKFNSTPILSDLTGTGTKVGAYTITDGAIGGIGTPGTQKPTELDWEPKTSSGSLLATYFDKNQQIPALQGGTNSATFVVLTNQPPTQKFVSILGSNPIDPTSSLTSTYSPQNGQYRAGPRARAGHDPGLGRHDGGHRPGASGPQGPPRPRLSWATIRRPGLGSRERRTRMRRCQKPLAKARGFGALRGFR